MKLPKIDLPTYNIKLPISKIDVSFRPYLSKEQKILLMAIETDDHEAIINAINQIINNCIITDLDITQIPISDTEFLFYNLRARSESEIVDLRYRCETPVDGKSCGTILPIDFNLLKDLDYSAIANSELSNIIELGQNKGIKLKYISFTDGELTAESTPDEVFQYYAEHVDSMYDEDSVYSLGDVTIKDFKEYLERLPIEQFLKIEKFFNNQPSIEKVVTKKCHKCNTEHKILVEDIFSFLV